MRLVSHPNIVALKAFFYSNGEKKDEVFLNLVLDFVPETVYRASRHYTKLKQAMPMLYVKVYFFHLFFKSYLLLALHLSALSLSCIYSFFGNLSSRY